MSPGAAAGGFNGIEVGPFCGNIQKLKGTVAPASSLEQGKEEGKIYFKCKESKHRSKCSPQKFGVGDESGEFGFGDGG